MNIKKEHLFSIKTKNNHGKAIYFSKYKKKKYSLNKNTARNKSNVQDLRNSFPLFIKLWHYKKNPFTQNFGQCLVMF